MMVNDQLRNKLKNFFFFSIDNTDNKSILLILLLRHKPDDLNIPVDKTSLLKENIIF